MMPKHKATLTIRKANGLTFLKVDDPSSHIKKLGTTEDMAALVDFDHPVWYWHRRLGHLGLDNMRRLVKHSTGIALTDQQIREQLKGICPVCAVTRTLVKVPRDPAKRHSQTPGELMHMDSWGPYSMEGYDGTKYFLFITDDATRYTWCARYSEKGDMYQTFKDLHRYSERSTGIVIRNYRMDGEFSRGPVGQYCVRKGLGVEATKPYQHYQAGPAERVNRIIREKAAPMMQEPNLTGQITKIITHKGNEMMRETRVPEKLWPEAIEHSVWLKNRSPARALKKRDKKTPWEALKDEKPDFGIERIWGSRTYVAVPPELRGPKIHAQRGWVGYWVGCESESISKVFSPDDHRVFNIGNARVHDGVGLEDPHVDPPIHARLPGPTSGDYEDLLDEEEEESHTQLTPEHSMNEGEEEEAEFGDMEDEDLEDEESEEEENPGTKDPGTMETENNEDDEVLNEQPIGEEEESDLDNEERHDMPTTSRFFNNAATTSRFFNTAQAKLAKEDSDSDTDSDSTLIGIKSPYAWNPMKCDACFRYKTRCIPGPGTKCTTCKKYRRLCFPQTRRTQRLVSRGKRQNLLEAPRCHNCRDGGLSCVFIPGQKCHHCQKTGRHQCTIENDESKLAYEKRLAHRRKYQQTQRDKISKATGKIKATVVQNKAESKGQKDKCLKCKSCKRTCDYGTPCNRCKDSDTVCTYTAQNGLVARKYNTKPIQSESDEECLTCIRKKRNCDQGEPCYRCVQHKSGDPCTYMHRNGFKESFNTCVWTIKDGYATLKDGYQYNAWHTLPKGLRGKLQSLPPSDDLFIRTFPSGHETMETSGDNLLCALHAIILSYSEQPPPDTYAQPPTIQQVQDIVASSEYQDLMKDQDTMGEVETTNTNFFGGDQAGAILWLWGRQRNLNLRLGIHTDDDTYLVGTQTDDNHPHTIWIHHNGAGHWEGIKGRKKPRPARQTRRKRTDKDSNSDTSDDGDNNPHFKKQKQVNNDIAKTGNIYLVQETKHSPVGTKEEVLKVLKMMYNKAIAEGKNADITKVKYAQEPQTFAEALRDENAPLWIQGAMDELIAHIENGTWKQAELPKGRKALTARWVFKLKLNNEGKVSRFKARLVARGFQQKEGIDYQETFAPAVKSDSYRVLFAIAAALGWTVYQYDVKTAFLHGELTERIFMKAPDGVPILEGKVLELLKALYGLKQAPRAWYEKLRKALLDSGWRVMVSDPCVFVHDQKQMYMGVWVDDIFITGPSSEHLGRFKEELGTVFQLQDLGVCSYYLGMNVRQENDSITIDQAQYIQQMLESEKAQDIAPSKTPGNTQKPLKQELGEVDPVFRTAYQSTVGKILYAANAVRPDIAFTAGYLARYMSNPNQTHMDAARRALAYLKETQYRGIRYKKGNLNIHGYSDSDHGGEDGKSTSSYIFFIANGAVAWKSQKQKTVAMSTEAAEYIAAGEAAKQAIWMKNFINELNIKGCQIEQVPIYIDNNSALSLTKNPVFHAKTKHLDLRHHWIREKVNDTKELTTHRVATKENVADIGTKFLARDQHKYLLRKMNMIDVRQGETHSSQDAH
jgi:hypothetical protein